MKDVLDHFCEKHPDGAPMVVCLHGAMPLQGALRKSPEIEGCYEFAAVTQISSGKSILLNYFFFPGEVSWVAEFEPEPHGSQIVT